MNITTTKAADYRLNRVFALVLGGGCVIVVAWLLITAGLIPRMTNDGAGYIEEARNGLEGHGLARTPSGIEPLDQDYVKEGFFPSGFPLVLESLGQLHVSIADAAVLVPISAWILLPAVYVWAFFPLLPLPYALIASFLLTSSPGIILVGGDVVTDVVFLTLSLLAFGCIIRSFSYDHPLRYAFVAGVILGLSYWVRYAAIALVLAFFTALATTAILRFVPRRAVLYRVLAMLGGCAPILFASLIRNYEISGTLQPYAPPASSLDLSSFIAVTRGYFSDLLVDLSGFRNAGLLAWDIKLFLLIVVPLIIYVGWIVRRQAASSGNPAALRIAVLVLGLYLCAGSAMVILTKARYGAVDELRYVIQYTWIVITLLALTPSSLAKLSGRVAHYAVLAAIVALIVGRVAFAWQIVDKEHRIQDLFQEYADWRTVAEHLPDRNWVLTNQMKIALAKNAAFMDAISRLPSRAYIISNVAGVLKETTKRPIRLLEADSPEEIARQLAQLRDAVNAAHTARPVYCVIGPTNRLVKIKGARPWLDVLADVLPPDYVTVWKQNDILILHYEAHAMSAKRLDPPSGTVSHDL